MTKRKVPQKKPVKWVAVSGGFDPLHVGHVRMFEAARKLGDKLVVILNNDNWLQKKKGYVFMRAKERAEILSALPFVDKVYITKHKRQDSDMSVCKALRTLRPAIFANGGDRKGRKDIPETKVCRELGIKMVFSVGGGKVQSSSWMIRDASRPIARTERPWGEFYGWDRGREWHLKTVYIKPGKRLSLQYHHHRAEHWMLVEGDAIATAQVGTKLTKMAMVQGELMCIDRKAVHRLESKRGGVVVEIALGKFDENDIVRIADDHGRVS
ncbi:MAG: adenylyltransferase/cytidyltransferase family protein [bacterium]|nr:adenylyltransferase/cytidyltransferase family protein [bacterium]